MFSIPVFLCCDLLIYDKENQELAEADDIFDVAASDSRIMISFTSYGDHLYLLDAAADNTQDAEVIQYKEKVSDIEVSASKKALVDAAVPEYTDTGRNTLAGLYDSGVADGYIGYPETMRFLRNRTDKTDVKQISIGEHNNIPHVLL